MEMADGIVINKADGDNIDKAKMAQRQLKNALHLYPVPESGWIPEVLTYSGFYDIGIDEVWDMVHRYVDFVKLNGYFDRKRKEQAKFWMFESINEQLRNGFYRDPEIAKLLSDLEKEVLCDRKSSFVAAKEALDRYYQRKKIKKISLIMYNGTTFFT